jgi:proline dehydrogenase
MGPVSQNPDTGKRSPFATRLPGTPGSLPVSLWFQAVIFYRIGAHDLFGQNSLPEQDMTEQEMTGRIGRWTLDRLDPALTRCRDRNNQGISCTLHVLDEYSKTAEEVDAIVANYRETISAVSTGSLRASVSVKLSSLGAIFDSDLALEETARLCREAKGSGVGFEIDMEGRGLVGAAIEAASACAVNGLPVILALQASLDRTPGDLRLLLAHGIVPRFVKGAYGGDTENFQEVQRRLLSLVREAAGYGVTFQIGTHDPLVIREVCSLMEGHRDHITFGFLMGLSDQTKLGLAGKGWKVSEYVPFGRDPGPYVARRERYLRELREQDRSPAP